jgi:hypothetical protein
MVPSSGTSGSLPPFTQIFLQTAQERTLYVSTVTLLSNRYKGKTIPEQSWTGPEGSRRLRLPDLKTFGT